MSAANGTMPPNQPLAAMEIAIATNSAGASQNWGASSRLFPCGSHRTKLATRKIGMTGTPSSAGRYSWGRR